jgi:hypothetical protein
MVNLHNRQILDVVNENKIPEKTLSKVAKFQNLEVLFGNFIFIDYMSIY